MKPIVISNEIKNLLDSVIDSDIALKKANQIRRKKATEYQKAKDEASKLLNKEAGKRDSMADYFFSEEGVLYRGQLFQFDDDGVLSVVDGPLMLEVE
ncbi:hypothetical protein OAP63_14395 [Vibrio sp.]|nr:hypothetical protein [Vibrio sp.]